VKNKPKFKLGQKLVVTGHCYSHAYDVGTEVTVCDIEEVVLGEFDYVVRGLPSSKFVRIRNKVMTQIVSEVFLKPVE